MFDISCKLSPEETICIKCQNLFSVKLRNNIANLSSAELAQRVVKVNSVKAFTIDKLRQINTKQKTVPKLGLNLMAFYQIWGQRVRIL